MASPRLFGSEAESASEASTEAGESLAEALLERVEHSESRSERAALLARLAAFYEDTVRDVERAFTTLLAADLEDESGEHADRLHRLAAATGRWEELAAHRVAQLANLAVEPRADALARLADLYACQLGDASRALAAADAALVLRPAHPAAASIRLELVRQTGDRAAIAAAIDVAVQACNDVERCVALLVEQARLHHQRMRPDLAKASCRRALREDPTSAVALAALESLVRGSGEVEELLEVLDLQIGIARDEERTSLQRRAAALLARSGHPERAIVRYERLRAEVPADPETLRALEALYEGKHPREHAETLHALAGVTLDHEERRRLYRKLATAWERLLEPNRAAEAWERLLACEGEAADDAAYDRLTRLYLEMGNACAAIDAITRHVEVAAPERRADLYRELGMLLEEHVQDPFTAIDSYEKANALLPGSETTLIALSRLYESTGALESAATRLEEAARLARTPAARAGRLARAAGLVLACPVGHERMAWAERLLEEALALQPGFPPAALALAPILRARGELQAARELLTLAVGRAADDDELVDLWLAIGEVQEALGDAKAALHSYRCAMAADPERRDVRVHACEVLYELGSHHELVPLLEQLCADEVDPTARVERLVRLARVLDLTGSRERARVALQRALGLAPEHLDARRLHGELLFAERRWGEAIEVFERVVADGESLGSAELARLKTRIGACAKMLADSSAELRAVEDALRLDPSHLGALKDAVQLYAERSRWLDALAGAERVGTTDPDPSVRARYWLLAARICADELYFMDNAIEHYRRALDEDQDLQDAALELERVLSNRGDHAGLVAHYTHRIKRLGPVGGPGDAERLRLWVALADLCALMGDKNATHIALEVATTIDGDRLDLRARLAETCVELGGDHVERAIAQHHEILKRDKRRVSSYRTLAGLYAQSRRPVEAKACQESAVHMAALRLAEDSGVGVMTTLPDPQEPIARRPLDEHDFALLRHVDESPALLSLLARIAPIVLSLEATPLRALRLAAKDALVSPTDGAVLRRCGEYARLLGVHLPALYRTGDPRRAAKFVNTHDKRVITPVLLLGHRLLDAEPEAHDASLRVALRLVDLRPERLLRIALPDPASLAVVLDAVFSLLPGATAAPEIAAGRTASALRTLLTPVAFDQVVAVASQLARDSQPAIAIATRWFRATELSAARALLALTGDLARAVSVVATDEHPGLVERNERVADLIWWNATEACATVRGRLEGTAPRDELLRLRLVAAPSARLGAA